RRGDERGPNGRSLHAPVAGCTRRSQAATERGRTRTERSQAARARCRLHAPVADCDGEGANADRAGAGCTRPLQAAAGVRRGRGPGARCGRRPQTLTVPATRAGPSAARARTPTGAGAPRTKVQEAPRAPSSPWRRWIGGSDETARLGSYRYDGALSF